MFDDVAQARCSELGIGLWKYILHESILPSLFFNLQKLFFDSLNFEGDFCFDLLRHPSLTLHLQTCASFAANLNCSRPKHLPHAQLEIGLDRCAF